MGNDKSISIRFDPEDMDELREFMKWRMQKSFVSIDSNSDFNLRDAAGLIKRTQQEKQNILRQIEAQRGQEEALGQQRENVSLLPDHEAERIQAEWREQSRLQAQNYCDSRNRHSHPRSTQGVDPDLLQSTLSWIKRTKMRGGLGGPKTLNKN